MLICYRFPLVTHRMIKMLWSFDFCEHVRMVKGKICPLWILHGLIVIMLTRSRCILHIALIAGKKGR